MGVQKLRKPADKQVKKYLSQASSVSNSITTQQILDMGVQKLRKLPEKQTRKYLSQVFSAANKRVANLSKLEHKPTALKHVQASGITKFGVKGKTTKELWKQYAVVQDLWGYCVTVQAFFIEATKAHRRGNITGDCSADAFPAEYRRAEETALPF